ncbi:MAG: endonuclease domain-containing protein [Desulfobacterales bacterium]|nr:endonuclease domain-containing protein [Desulfobacterales bacterium]
MVKAKDRKFTEIARDLRRSSTEAEKILWQRLRNKQLDGLKFRRQQAIGRYIVDFVNFDRKLVIELDGGQHAVEKEKDRERDQWLQTQGFEVLRYWNNEILENLEGVLEVIRKKLLSPSPGPSHQGEGMYG